MTKILAWLKKFLGNDPGKLIFMGLLLWFLIIWIEFHWRGLNTGVFEAYAMFGTAIATALLAFETYLMARETKKSTDQSRKLAEAPHVKELVTRVVNPLLGAVDSAKNWHEKRKYAWGKYSLESAKKAIGGTGDVEPFRSFKYVPSDAFLPNTGINLENAVTVRYEPLYRDFGRRHSTLVYKMEEYDKKAADSWHLLVRLAGAILGSQRFNELVEKWPEPETWNQSKEITLWRAYLTFLKLLGASQEFYNTEVDRKLDPNIRDLVCENLDSVVGEVLKDANIKDKVDQIIKEAASFVKALQEIESGLSQIRDKYREEYHLTYEETGEKDLG